MFCDSLGKYTCVKRPNKMAAASVFVLMCLFMADLGHCTISVLDSNDVLAEGIRTAKSVDLNWGIADTTASVGRFFNYSIPRDAFKGVNLVHKVTEAGKDSLPHWLTFNSEKQVLQGIPSSEDLGQYSIEVTAIGTDQASAKDIFSIFVTEDGGSASAPLLFKAAGAKTVRCKRSEPETAVRLIIDVDINALDASNRLQLHENIIKHLNLAEDMLKINQLGNTPITDASALVSGSGDAKDLKTKGSSVSWLVGCGKVEPDHMSILQQVETDASNGEMSNAIKYPIHVWHVTNSRFQEHKRRKRQAVRATATSVATPTLPVKGPTDTIRATGTEHDAMTRPVASLHSPSFGIQPTKTVSMEKTRMPGEGEGKIMPTKAPEGGVKPSAGMPDEGKMTKTQVLPTKTYVMTDEVRATKTMPKPTDTEGEATKDPIGDGCMDLVPTLKNPIRNLHYTVGTPIKFRIPEDTFYDCRVGNTRKLRIILFDDKKQPMLKKNWISLDAEKQVITGLPMEEHIGKHRFSLVAMNKKEGDKPAMTTFSVNIKEDTKAGERNHEMSVTMDYDYDEFTTSTEKKVMFLSKVARIYGERNPRQLTLTRISKGSTVVAWTNTSLSSPGCPADEIKTMSRKIANEDGTPTQAAVDGLHPYKLVSVGVEPLGACEDDPNFPLVAATTGDDTDTGASPDEEDNTGDQSSDKPPTTTEGVKTGGVGGSSDDIWITTVVPAVVIVAILLLALLIACILYRKKRKGKMNLEDQNTFVNKGVPVIFQDELEEKPTDSSKPLLMEGQPPCPPPEYQRGDSQSSTPPVNHKQPQYDLDGDLIEDTNVNSPLYQPPPPVTSSGNNKTRPHVSQPAYRSQPPSIPP